MFIKPENLRTKMLSPQQKKSENSVVKNNIVPAPKKQSNVSINNSSESRESHIPKKVDSRSLAKNFANQKADRLALKSEFLNKKTMPDSNTAESQKTGSARYLDKANFKRTVFYPTPPSREVFDGELGEEMKALLKAKREMDHTPADHNLQLEVMHFDNKDNKKEI